MSLDRATAALSSADMAQPIFGKLQSFRRDNATAAFALLVVRSLLRSNQFLCWIRLSASRGDSVTALGFVGSIVFAVAELIAEGGNGDAEGLFAGSMPETGMIKSLGVCCF